MYMYVQVCIFMYMYIACTYMFILVHNFINMYIHVCTMYLALCTDLQILVHVVRIPDAPCYYDSGQKSYEGKEHSTQNLRGCENRNQVKMSGRSCSLICIQTVCNKVDTIFSSRIVF